MSIEPGAANAYTLKLFVRPRATGWFVNNAQVSQYGDKPSDPTPADNTSSDPTKVGCPPVGTSNETVPLLCTTKNDGDPLLSAPRGATDLDASIYQEKPFTYTIRGHEHTARQTTSRRTSANPVVVP